MSGPSIAVAVGTLDAANALVVADVLKVGDPKINDYQVNYPFINKYRHAHSKIENTDDNWPVYRYADCLLLLAEVSGGARTVQKLTAPMESSTCRVQVYLLLQQSMPRMIADERRHELAFDHNRWYDLFRTGKSLLK